MLTSKIKELETYKAKIVQLEKSVQAEREKALANAHVDLGFASRKDLIKALRALEKGGGRRGKVGRPAKSAGGKARRKRTTITPELKDKIIAAVREGGTGMGIARQFGVSLPTVQNIKRAAGLTRKAAAGGGKGSAGA